MRTVAGDADVAFESARASRMPVARYLPLAGIVAIAALLRFPTLGLQSFWDDEGHTVRLMRVSLSDLLPEVRESESAPPIYYVTAWLWTHAFGISEAALRSLSAVAGTALVAVVYAATRPFASHRAGLVAAAVTAVNPLLVWYSQEARAYAMFTLFSAAAFACFGYALAQTSPRRQGRFLWGWALFAVLGLYTHYFALFLVVPEAAVLLWRFHLRRVLAQFSLVAVSCVALLPLVTYQRGKEFGFADNPIIRRTFQVPEQFLVGFGVWSETLGKLAAVVAALTVVLGAVLALQRSQRSTRPSLLIVAGVGSFALAVPIGLAVIGFDYLTTRNCIGALVPAVIFISAGWAYRRAGLVAAVVFIGIALAVNLAVILTPRFQREDIRGVVRALPRTCEGRAIVISPNTVIKAYLPQLRPMPSQGAKVSEIDLAAMPVKEAGRREVVPRQLRRPSPAPGFRLVERIHARRFTVVRFASSTPRHVMPTELAPNRLGPWPVRRVGVFWEACSRSADPT
jgi:mannosyltransferase